MKLDEAQIARERGPFAGGPGHRDAPFCPAPEEAVARMLDLAEVGPGDRVIDLGCGDGRIVLAAARRGAEARGIDVDPERVAEAEAAARAAGVEDRVRFTTGDLFAVDLAPFSVVTLYLLPGPLRWLQGRLQRDLRRGARVVSFQFAMPEWRPTATERYGHSAIYLWTA
jgi:SAM-dependent methyltransferase